MFKGFWGQGLDTFLTYYSTMKLEAVWGYTALHLRIFKSLKARNNNESNVKNFIELEFVLG
jgi:hypothetical protein